MEQSGQQGSTNPPSGPPAGWYPDPNTPNQQRHWDGFRWTDQIAPLSPPSIGATGPTQRWGHVVSVLGSLGIIIGSLGPWATSALESVPGTEVDGQVTLIGGVIALILVGSRRLIALAVVIAILTVIIGISDISDVNSYSVEAFGTEVHPASVGWGLWLVVASGAGLAVGGSRLRSELRTEEIEEQVEREIAEEEAVEAASPAPRG